MKATFKLSSIFFSIPLFVNPVIASNAGWDLLNDPDNPIGLSHSFSFGSGLIDLSFEQPNESPVSAPIEDNPEIPSNSNLPQIPETIPPHPKEMKKTNVNEGDIYAFPFPSQKLSRDEESKVINLCYRSNYNKSVILTLLNFLQSNGVCPYAVLKTNVTSFRKEIYSLCKLCERHGLIEAKQIGFWNITPAGQFCLKKLCNLGIRPAPPKVGSDQDNDLPKRSIRRARSLDELNQDPCG